MLCNLPGHQDGAAELVVQPAETSSPSKSAAAG
jgi:hypothetical protein